MSAAGACGGLRRAGLHPGEGHRDFHVEVAKALYSLPAQWIGQHLDARADSELVKLYCGGQAGPQLDCYATAASTPRLRSPWTQELPQRAEERSHQEEERTRRHVC